MKKNKQSRNKGFYYVFIIIAFAMSLIFVPISFVKESQGEVTTIITSVGLDNDAEKKELNVSLQILSPDITGQNLKKVAVIEGKGNSLLDAFTSLSFKLGKQVGLEHCSVIAIGEGFEGEDVFPYLDWFYRSGKINLNTVLVDVNGKAKDLLSQTSELNNMSSGSIQNNIEFNSKYFGSSKISTLGIFFNEYYKKGHSCIVTVIDMKEDAKGGESSGQSSGGDSGESSSSGSGGQEEGASSGSEGKSGGGESAGSSGEGNSGGGSESGGGTEVMQNIKLVNNGSKSTVYKNGVKTVTAGEIENNGFNWLDNRVKLGIVQVENVSDINLKNATVTMDVQNSRVRLIPKIENNRFVIKARIKVFGVITEIKEEHQSLRISNSLKKYLTEEVKEAIKKKIAGDVQNALQFCKANNVDAMNLEDTTFRLAYNKYKKLTSKLAINDNFLEYADIETDISVYNYR